MIVRALAAGMVLFLTAPGAALDLSIEPEFPVEGEEARLVVSDGGTAVPDATVRVTYRPNSEVSREAEIGVTDADGALTWRPDDAGMAQLAVAKGDESGGRAVSIRFAGPPSRGIVIFLLAGLILFGGNFRFISRMLKARA